MSDDERLFAELNHLDRQPHDAHGGESHARTIIRAMDLLFDCDDVEGGIIDVLRLCHTATSADLWMLLHYGRAGIITLAAGPQDLVRPVWTDAKGFLSRARRVVNLPETPWFQFLPDELRAFLSIASVPLDWGGGPPMAMLLLSRQEAAFSKSDHELLQAVGRLVQRTSNDRRLEHQNKMLADVLENAPATEPDYPAFLSLSSPEKIRAYARLAEWQGAILEITNDLLGAPAVDPEAAINHALAKTGELAGSDRTYVFRLRDPDRIDNTHEWTASGIEPMIAQLQDMPASLLDEWHHDMLGGHAVHIPDVEALPENSSVREVLVMQQIRSLLAVPMLRDGTIAGFVGFDAVRTYRRFLPLEIQLLQAVANAVNIVLDRYAAETAAETARAHLEAERNRLHTTMAAIPDLVLELDHEGRFIAHAAGSGLGTAIPPAQFLGRLPEDVLPPDLADFAHRVMRMVDREGLVTGQEYELEIDGEPRWFSLSAAAKREHGLPSGFVFVIRDITGQLIQRKRLQRLSTIAELTSNLVVVTDTDQRIEWVNPAFERRTGWPLEDIRGKRPDSFLKSEKTDHTEMRRIGAALRQGKPVRAELLNQSRQGDEYWISKDIQPIFGTDGQVEGFIAVQTDITEMKLSHQKALHDRAVALDASGDGIAITDSKGHYIYMNAAHRHMFGIREDEDINALHWHKIYQQETIQSFMAKEWHKLQATGRWRGELHGVHRNGSPVPQEVSLTLHNDGILWLTRDISEQLQQAAEHAKMREGLQLAQRRETIAHLASGVAHDLNNLVAVVAGSVTLLQQKLTGDEDAQANVERIKRAAETARDIVSGLGHLGRAQGQRATHDLRDLIMQGVDLLGSRRLRDYELLTDLTENPTPVWANVTELLQVIVNLTLNACEANANLPNRVRLTICEESKLPSRPPDAGMLRRDAEHSVFTISDSGVGIDAKVQQRLFERYFTTKGENGTGLGLPIVAGILRDNAAALWIESTPGFGTIVTVAWPARKQTSAVSEMGRHTHSEILADLNGRNILVVDDLPDVSDIFSEFLEARGANAVALSDPQEAAELLRNDPLAWAALVTDLDMPGLNGKALARIAAACEPAIPVILVTALPEVGVLEAELFSDILPKPVQAEQLATAVYAAIHKAEMSTS
jgi:PAS domain S-box-containing protein